MGKLKKLIEYLLSRPPEARFEDISYVLEAFGYQEVRSRGSHHAFENEQGEVIIIPKKGGKKVKRTYIEETIRLLDLENWKDEN
ncbi:type II toxin-antitoxin system HicA family toxin [Planktothrix sp. FACHB-1355]|uniref:Type II toxin-antitoxin system HicA family toxin n=1 Tax=Aerosakkonema funiforme FACHB-1375 TaxID=2949571 RepID=A0A926VDB0_9CYAN|nr:MULTISPECIES: type II toxin-antitoxin system HicA family toxin [Oscillatoriales]MBD2181723.1 type II toxin-antitoxin system HicA family toxin [Aerosakkonema funiforme FACHB-1375]MBD3560989.1 type II toxin-antitoxin system HicA family toxin [Planktothrix sp. FACHB-1355]